MSGTDRAVAGKNGRIEHDGLELELIGPAPNQGPARQPSTRTKARKRALDILFEAELRGIDPLELLTERRSEENTPPVRVYTSELVHGVVDHRDEIDTAITGALRPGWTLQRMPRIDRNLARIALFEVLHTDLADKIAVAEAVALAEELSTDDSASFVNGLLGTLTEPTG
ncbi:transcription antitermination factor NusB [Enemella evansiae]|uniref:transcription antitermination factor NusB n=1 Tax=Enemella evansiae TaxID=2016499 RepID=UPI001E2E13B2|nr:transcription antitermination factor NusB [Enemella evansiae]